MRTLTQSLNMSPGGIPPVIHVSQYDSDFTIVFTLFSTVGDFTIEAGTTAMVRGTKSSGTGYSADATINISAKTVTVTGNQQMTAAAGQNVFEITLLKGNKEISSKNFILLCERAALDADTITDESVLKELNAIIESADTATQAAEEAEDAADRAEAAAQTLVIDSTLTKPGQPADAKATGDAIAGLEDDIAQIVPGLSEDAKTALLACFQHVAWVDGHGQDYYDALYAALYNEEPPVPEPEIPEGYTQFDYITVNTADTISGQSGLLRKNQLLLPLTGDKNTYKYEMLINNYAQQGACTFGGRDSSGNADSLAFYLTSSDPKTFTIHCRGESYKSATIPSLSQEEHVLHVIFNPSVNPTVVKIDDDTVTRAWANQSQTMSASLALFGNPAPDASNDIYRNVFPDQIGRLKVYNSSDELVCDCIPCSNQSGKYGMYDTVTETFITSTDANTYTCGNWN